VAVSNCTQGNGERSAIDLPPRLKNRMNSRNCLKNNQEGNQDARTMVVACAKWMSAKSFKT
jgi:hypothetical protein